VAFPVPRFSGRRDLAGLGQSENQFLVQGIEKWTLEAPHLTHLRPAAGGVFERNVLPIFQFARIHEALARVEANS